LSITSARLRLRDKDTARSYFYQLRQKFLDWNGAPWESEQFKSIETDIRAMIDDKKSGAAEPGERGTQEGEIAPEAGGGSAVTAAGEGTAGAGAGAAEESSAVSD
jgi:hypothetical protein